MRNNKVVGRKEGTGESPPREKKVFTERRWLRRVGEFGC